MVANVSPDLTKFFTNWLFSEIPQASRDAILAKLKVCQFSPGQPIWTENEFPAAVHFIVHGQVRILGAASCESPTLALLNPGDCLGWAPLIRRVTGGSAQAAITLNAIALEVVTIALPADEFEEIALQYLLPTLANRTDITELFDVLVKYRSSFATQFSVEEVKRLVTQMLQSHVKIVNWTSSTDLTQLAPERLWLVSGGAPLSQAIGTSITAETKLEQQRDSLFPVRLIGIDRTLLFDFPTEENQPASDPISTASEGLVQGFPNSPCRASQRYRSQPYPISRSRSADRLEDTVACFTMLFNHLEVPFQADSLRQWLYRLGGDQTLELCGRIAEVFNVTVKTVRFTPTSLGINRMATPALIQWADSFAVLYEVTPTTVRVGSPREGLLTLSPQQISGYIAVDAETQTGRGLVFERTPMTASKKFGLSWFLPSVNRYRWTLFQVLIASIFVQLLGLANPLLIQQIFDKVIVTGNGDSLPTFGVLLLIFALFEAVLNTLRTYLFVDTTNRIDLTLGTAVIQQLLNLPLTYFEKRTVGELSARIAELENIRQFLTGTTLTVLMDALFSVLYIVVMLFYSIPLTIVALISVPIVIGTTLLISPLLQKLIRSRAEKNAHTQSYLVEILAGIFTVKAQNIEALARTTWRDRYVKYVAVGFKAIMLNTAFSSFSNFINTVSGLVVLWIGASLVLQNELSLGGLIAFRIIAGYVTGPLLRLAQLWERFQEVRLSMSLVGDVLDSAPEMSTLDQSQVFMPTIQGRVSYENISFGFTPGQLQLINLNLEFSAGTFVGIVGQSGSGKSTLTKLLPRLYLPNSGKIFVDGYDIAKVNLNSLRSQIGIVPQDSILFQGTIRENITQMREGTDEAVMDAARVAVAHDFIMSLPDGYNTQVSERGSSLSGGQRQRIAIARMVFQNPRLLILDEATSALDYTTERQVCENLKQRFCDPSGIDGAARTVFFITHRLATIRNADTILLMQSGIVVEQGTHTELMTQRQLYFLLYNQQAQASESRL